MNSPSPLQIRLLGRFVVRRDGHDIPARAFGGRLARTLLRLLISRRGTFFPKDSLADALWRDRPPADPSANLDALVSRARRALGDPTLIVTGPGGYVFAEDDRCTIDIEVVRSKVAVGRGALTVGEMETALRSFREALDAWGGEPLPEDAYSDWAAEVRTEMQRLQLEALEGGAEAALSLADADQAVELAEMAVVREPLRERGHLLLVRALAGAGDQAGALLAFDALRSRFTEELGLDPSKEAFDLQRRVLRGELTAEATALAEILGAGRIGMPTGGRVLGSTLGGEGSGPVRARTLATMAMLAAGSDDYERGGRLAELALAEAGDDAAARAEALAACSVVDMNLGLLERSAARSGEALGLFESLGDDHGAARILDVRAMAAFLGGHIRKGVEEFVRVARMFQDAGDLVGVVTPRSTCGHGLVFMARPDEGLKEIEDALDLARGLGDAEREGYCLWHRSEALTALGREDESVVSAEEAVAIAERLRHREWTAASLRGLGIAAAAAGDVERAQGSFRASLEMSDGMPLFKAWAAARLALVLTEGGRLEEAGSLVELALAEGTPLSLFEARLAHAELAAALGRTEAASIARDALTIAEVDGHLQSAPRLRELASRR